MFYLQVEQMGAIAAYLCIHEILSAIKGNLSKPGIRVSYIAPGRVSIVRPARRLPAGFLDSPVRAGLSDERVRLAGPIGRTALTQAGRPRASASTSD
jgi:hypothetical protein